MASYLLSKINTEQKFHQISESDQMSLIQQIKKLICAVLDDKSQLTHRDIEVLGKKMASTYKDMFQSMLTYCELIKWYSQRNVDLSVFIHLAEMQSRLLSFIRGTKSKSLGLDRDVNAMHSLVLFLKTSLLYDVSFLVKSTRLKLYQNKLVTVLKNMMNGLWMVRTSREEFKSKFHHILYSFISLNKFDFSSILLYYRLVKIIESEKYAKEKIATLVTLEKKLTEMHQSLVIDCGSTRLRHMIQNDLLVLIE